MRRVRIGFDALGATMFMAPDGQVYTSLPEEGGQVYYEWISQTGLSGSGFAILEWGWEPVEAYRGDQIPSEAVEAFQRGKPVVLFWGHGSRPELVVTAQRLPNNWEPSWRGSPSGHKPERRALWWEGHHDGWRVSMRSPWWVAVDYGCAHLRVVAWTPNEESPTAHECLRRLATAACWLSLRAEGQRVASAAFCGERQGVLLRNGVEVSPWHVLSRMERQDVALPFVRYKGRIWQFNPAPTLKDTLAPLTQVGEIPTTWSEAFETKGELP